jgi:hypothetical protein
MVNDIYVDVALQLCITVNVYVEIWCRILAQKTSLDGRSLDKFLAFTVTLRSVR